MRVLQKMWTVLGCRPWKRGGITLAELHLSMEPDVMANMNRMSAGGYIRTWGSGPLLRMACTSPVRFNWFLCRITEKIGD